MDQRKQLIHDLFDIGAIIFEKTTLKCGIVSPIYCDLRVVVQYDDNILTNLTKLMWDQVKDSCKFDMICGMPYGALFLAYRMRSYKNIPFIYHRKEAKYYGTNSLIVGNFEKGQKILIVEDVITTGSSVLEGVNILRNAGLVVEDVVVFLDRECGGSKNLEDAGLKVYRVFTLLEIIKELTSSGKINKITYDETISQLNKQIAKDNIAL